MSERYINRLHALCNMSTVETLRFIDAAVQMAFQRGAGVRMDETERDAVDLAKEAHINNPEVLSNLYSREQGFKP